MNSKSHPVRVQQVATTGTSWIICRSKTHKGRIYYFNTVSGEATWNLSEAEMEKARRTKNPTQEDFNIIGACPEPSEPPSDQTESPTSNTFNNVPSTSSNIPSSSTIYNKQVINNQFPKQQFPLSPFIVPGLNVVSNVVPNVVQNPVTVFPFSMNSSDTNVWAVTPQQQILFNPNLPVVNLGQPVNVQFTTQGQPPVDVHFNNQGQCLNMPFGTQMQYANQRQPANEPYRNQDIPLSAQNIPKPSSSCYQRRGFKALKYQKNKKRAWDNGMQSNMVKSKFDLRKVLSARHMQKKKNQANNKESESNQEQNSSALPEKREEHDIGLKESALRDTQTLQPGHVDVDEVWIEDHFFIKEGKITLDLTNLKNLAANYMDPQRWYIVADKDILLNHLNFLIIVCNSDEDCCLMVPRYVLSDLQAAKEDSVSRVATKAKRAVVFLVQNSDREKVVIGDTNSKETDTRCDYMLNCCTKLMEQFYFVVLLSNDEEFDKLKDNTQVPVFNINKLKQLLSNDDQKKERLKPSPCLTKKHVDIPVNNDLNREANANEMFEQSDSIEINRNIPNQTVLNQKTKTQELMDGLHALSMSNSSPKQVSTSVVQSDVAENNLELSRENVNSDDIPTTPSVNNSKTLSNNTNKQRAIRLKRSISVKTPQGTEETPVSKDEKRQYRWRKKRLASGNCSNDCKTSSTVSSNFKRNEASICHIKAASTTSDESLLNESFKLNTTNKKVIIEETSTSENISNSESEGGNQATSSNLVFQQLKQHKKVMFEIEDNQMEHSLQVMKDEWLSRFWQIMDEVMPQILREDETFLHGTVYRLYGGGPWTIPEAIDCVKMKFKNCRDVQDAANQLSTLISNISDSNGRIIANIKPSVFMKLYSYGVYLIEALKLGLGNCEDLDTASQSLLKLLDDIKNPNLDSTHTDNFSDHYLPDTSYNILPDTSHMHVPHSPTIQKSPVASPSVKKLPKVIQQRPQNSGAIRSYNLRSKFNSPVKPPQVANMDQPVDTNTTNKQDSFFSSLNLVKKVSHNRESSYTSDPNATGYEGGTASIFDKYYNTSETQPSTSKGKAKAMGDSKLSPESKKTIENKKPEERVPLDMDRLDYSEYNDDYEHVLQSNHNFGQDEKVDENILNEELPAINLVEPNNNSFLEKCGSGNFEFNSPLIVNDHLNYILSRFFGEVNQALEAIRRPCKNTMEELRGIVFSRERKFQLLYETKKMQAMLDYLCKSLHDIYARETVGPDNNIQELLAEAGINDFDLDDNILKSYRRVVFTAFQQAEILQESVALLIAIICRKPVTL